MNPQYERLLRTAEETFEVHGPSAVVKALSLRGLQVTDQQMGNWKSRGIPGRALVDAAHILEVIPQWLATGTGPKRGLLKTALMAQEEPAPYEAQRQSIQMLMTIVQNMDDAGVYQLVGQARILAAEHPLK